MSPQPSATDLKALQRETWQRAAPGYSKWVCEANGLPEVMQKYADMLEGHFGRTAAIKVLDLASASGEPALTVAKHLPNAQVVSTDLVDTYQELGRARAAAAGVQGRVTFEVADAEDLHSYADGSFDVVTCSFGLMFLPTLSAGLAEIHRVLKPGGIVAVTVWKSLTHMPYIKTLMDFCTDLDPESLKGTPPNYAFKFGDDARELLDGLRAANFHDIAREDLAGTFALPANGWWQAVLDMPLPLARLLAKQKEEGKEDAFEAAKSKLKVDLTEKGFLNPDESFVVGNNKCHFVKARK